MFLVPRDTPGFRVGKVFNKSGWRFYQNARDDFRERARAARQRRRRSQRRARKSGAAATPPAAIFSATSSSAPTRSAFATPPAKLRCVTPRPRSRAAKPLFEQQNVQLKINKMHMLTEALRSFVMRVAWEHDMKITLRNAGLAMNYSTDVMQEVTELNMDVRGVQRLRDGSPHRQAGARFHHLDPSRRRQRAAHEGGAEIGGRRLAG